MSPRAMALHRGPSLARQEATQVGGGGQMDLKDEDLGWKCCELEIWWLDLGTGLESPKESPGRESECKEVTVGP
jgi:hypothetical protein